MFTLGIYSEDIDPEKSTFSGIPELNSIHISEALKISLWWSQVLMVTRYLRLKLWNSEFGYRKINVVIL